jgi:hypothetical protein
MQEEQEQQEQKPAPRFSYLRFLVETYYDVQAQRIMAENRLRSYAKANEEEQKQQLQSMSDWVDQRMATCEAELKALVLKECRKIPFAKTYLLKTKGVGPCIAGGIVAYVETPARFDTISKLWAYAGFHTVEGKAPRKMKGEKANWNPHLKRICWLAGESFVKVTTSPYRDLYDQFKKKYKEQHPEPVDTGKKNKKGEPIFNYTPGHIHSMAKRKVVKIWLSHIWLKWREAEGLPTSPPYIIGRDGHTHMIDVA